MATTACSSTLCRAQQLRNRPTRSPAAVKSQRCLVVAQAGQHRQGPAVWQSVAGAAASVLLLASPALAESSSAVEALKGSFRGPQDPIEQRKALGDYVDKKDDGLGIGRLEDATIDNPNDSPRPKDRTRMKQPFSALDSKSNPGGEKLSQSSANTSEPNDSGQTSQYTGEN